MKEKDITKDADLETAKEFLNNMLSGLNKEEKKNLLKNLLNLTHDL